MKPALARIRQSVRRARDAGLEVAIWWRDDDAVAPTPSLDRLIELARRHDMTIGLAVIPALAGPALAARLAGEASVVPMVHGLRHANHASAGHKKAEFGPHRDHRAGLADVREALDLHHRLFGAQASAWFVPPWNRIAPALVTDLASVGYAGLSTFGDKLTTAPGLEIWNTHVDPIDWHGTRSAVEADVLARQTEAAIEQRLMRQGQDLGPIGLLTHHLVHDDAVWTLAEAWLEACKSEGAVNAIPAVSTNAVTRL